MDCSNFKNFVDERKRMCKTCDCKDCGLYKLNSYTFCATRCFINPDEAIKIVQEWSDNNPIITRMSRLLETFPRVSMDDEGLPKICASDIYGNNCPVSNDCKACWNAPLEDSCEH